MQVLPGDAQGMNERTTVTEGARFEALGCHLVVERSGNKIRRLFFSKELQQPSEDSELVKEIIRHVTEGVPCPKVELDLSGFNDFQRKVVSVVMDIPRGRTMTYGQVAALAGHPGAARAVGNIMAKNPFVIIVPCHRVVARQGLGGFGFGLHAKERLLAVEASNL